jgi:hypothetical protein
MKKRYPTGLKIAERIRDAGEREERLKGLQKRQEEL